MKNRCDGFGHTQGRSLGHHLLRRRVLELRKAVLPPQLHQKHEIMTPVTSAKVSDPSVCSHTGTAHLRPETRVSFTRVELNDLMLDPRRMLPTQRFGLVGTEDQQPVVARRVLNDGIVEVGDVFFF